MNTSIGDTLLWLTPDKCIWIADQQMLVISDLHIGKIEHFRNAGIPLPEAAGQHTILKLASALDRFQPLKVIFLGDLFHSVQNAAFNQIVTLLSSYTKTEFILVKGNHDILSSKSYQDINLTVVNEYISGNLWFTHEPQVIGRQGLYNLAGHIHPGIKIKGKGKQSMILPCFYFGPTGGILPAFGYFTGKYIIKIEKKSNIFVVAEDKIFRIEAK